MWNDTCLTCVVFSYAFHVLNVQKISGNQVCALTIYPCSLSSLQSEWVTCYTQWRVIQISTNGTWPNSSFVHDDLFYHAPNSALLIVREIYWSWSFFIYLSLCTCPAVIDSVPALNHFITIEFVHFIGMLKDQCPDTKFYRKTVPTFICCSAL